MTVRMATGSDWQIANKLAYKFCTEAYGKWTDKAVVTDLVESLIFDDDKVMFLYEEKGFLAGVLNRFILGGQTMAVELGWYVLPEYRKSGVGKDLIGAFEAWALSRGCDLITMVSIDNDVGAYYEKNGYKLYERTYMKEL